MKITEKQICEDQIVTFKQSHILLYQGLLFFNTINMCDRGRTITHMQIPRFHTQVWYNIFYRIIKDLVMARLDWIPQPNPMHQNGRFLKSVSHGGSTVLVQSSSQWSTTWVVKNASSHDTDFVVTRGAGDCRNRPTLLSLVAPIGVITTVTAKLSSWRFSVFSGGTSHYCDVIMGAMASQIISLTIVYSTVHSGADQRKHQSFASLAFVRGIHRWPVNPPHKWPVTRKSFHLMTSSCRHSTAFLTVNLVAYLIRREALS